ncbi:MAG TPA: rRNA maturation RNase YbeY [Terriglobales bacterium]|nr:rRNA maturation RNase YbeY [Terriglobales bacterium]
MSPATPPLLGGRRLDLPALRRFLAAAQRALGLRAPVAVRLMDDAAIQALNRQFRALDQPTDVLSFPAHDPAYAGDLAVSLDTAARQARARHHPLDTEVRILLLHGLLHLAGFDHEADQGQMRRRERQLRLQFGLPPGLIERQNRRKIKSSRSKP